MPPQPDDNATPQRRLFIGLMPEPAAQAALAATRQAWTWAGRPSFPPPERLHLTLHFLGDVPQAQAQVLQQTLAGVPMRAVQLALRYAAVWPGGTAVMLPADSPGLEVLQSLQRELGTVLQAAGMNVDTRPWRAHLTLARKAQGARPPAQLVPVTLALERFSLVWSRLGRTPGYEVLADFPARTSIA